MTEEHNPVPLESKPRPWLMPLKVALLAIYLFVGGLNIGSLSDDDSSSGIAAGVIVAVLLLGCVGGLVQLYRRSRKKKSSFGEATFSVATILIAFVLAAAAAAGHQQQKVDKANATAASAFGSDEALDAARENYKTWFVGMLGGFETRQAVGQSQNAFADYVNTGKPNNAGVMKRIAAARRAAVRYRAAVSSAPVPDEPVYRSCDRLLRASASNAVRTYDLFAAAFTAPSDRQYDVLFARAERLRQRSEAGIKDCADQSDAQYDRLGGATWARADTEMSSALDRLGETVGQ